MNSKLFNPIKTKIVATIALLFFVLLGAGTIMAMKSPDKAKAATEKKAVKHTIKAKLVTAWFTYNPGASDPTDPDNYTEVGSQPTCSGTATVCGIQATVDGSAPVINSTLVTEINNALSSHTPSTNVRLKAN